MGLDSYLFAEKFLSLSDNREEFEKITESLGLTGLIHHNAPTARTRVEIVYWRKANQIHNYFVSLGDGEDNCEDIHVSREDLENLLTRCRLALETQNKPGEGPEAILPTKSGFFFGSTDYDEYYYYQLEYTSAKLEKILAHEDFKDNWNWGFVYQASW